MNYEQVTIFDELAPTKTVTPAQPKLKGEVETESQTIEQTLFEFGQPVTVRKADESMSVEDYEHVKEYEGRRGNIMRRLPYRKLQYEVAIDNDVVMFYHDELEA